jgi:outer membrane lipoprotein-sorting protein
MKKMVLSLAAVAMLAGFAAGCAQPEKPAPAPVTRKG